MGGVYGFVGDVGENSRSVLDSMSKAMAHRGQEVLYCSSAPPFHGGVAAYPWEAGTRIVYSPDRNVTALCEGEIYNLKELILSLKNNIGKEIVSGFDLIPNLYAEYGNDFARKLNGVFAIALWDHRNNKLMLARDHLGSHSLFYAQTKEGIFFGSTISSVFSTGLVKRELDPSSLDRYLTSLAISPPHTMFKSVGAVRPGYARIIHNNRQQEHDYWRLWEAVEDYEKSEDRFSAELREIFEDAVKIRAEYGGEMGLLVSGGVDTSAITEVLAKLVHPSKLAGFSIAFEEKAFSDAGLQDITYTRLGLDRHQILLRPKEFADVFIACAGFLDSPVNDVASAGMLHTFRAAAASGCTAVFEGEASDEIFCTGHSHGELSVQRFLSLPFAVRHFLFWPFKYWFSETNTLPAKITRLSARIGMKDLERRCTWIPGFSRRTRKQLLGKEYISEQAWKVAGQYYQQCRLRDGVNIYQYGLSKLFLPDDLLFKNERMASAAGLINRTPFIDHRLVHKAFEIPVRYKLRNPTSTDDGTKLVFKKAMRGIVPDEILDRKKTRGFSQPTAIWYRNELKDFVQDTLFGKGARIYDWLNRRAVKQIYEDFMIGRASSDYFLNSMVILELWMQKHL